MTTKLVSYIRVSTRGQAVSGLGLSAQTHACEQYAAQSGGRIVAAYREVESGRANDRPQLHAALAHAKRSGATLLVAKMDRLSRNAAFLLTLRDAGVAFVALDCPAATPLVIGVMALFAEDEARRISQRTRDALQAAKRRGTRLGTPANLTQAHRERGAKAAGLAVARAASEAYSDLLPRLRSWRAEGLSLAAIAERLNLEGHTSRRGRPWAAPLVHRVLQRAG